MTEKEIENKIRETFASESPDLWERILEKLPEKEAENTGNTDSKQGKEIEEEAVPMPVETVEGAAGTEQKGRVLYMEEKKKFWQRKWVRIASGAAALVLVFGIGGSVGTMLFAGKGAGSSYASSMAMDSGAVSGAAASNGWYESAEEESAWEEEWDTSDMKSETTESTMGEDTEEVANAVSGRKLIYTYSLTLETLEFDILTETVKQQVEALGGYIESTSVNGSSYYYGNTRSASMTIRIPSGRTEGFVNQLGELGTVRYSSSNAEDITLSYVDTQSRLEALRTEQTRLLELMETAENTSDMLEIEKYLTDVRYEIQSCESRLRTMDNQVSYDTLYLNYNEVTKITPVEERTFLDKIKDGFEENLEAVGDFFVNTVIALITAIPFLLILIPVILIICLIWKLLKNRRNRKCNK